MNSDEQNLKNEPQPSAESQAAATGAGKPEPNSVYNNLSENNQSSQNLQKTAEVSSAPQRPPMVTAVPQKVCPICSTVFPQTLAACPKCGFSPYAAGRKAKKSGSALYKKWWFWLIIGTVVFALCITLITLIPRSRTLNDKASPFDSITDSAKWETIYNKQLEVRVKYNASLFTEEQDLLFSVKNTTDKTLRVVPSGASLDGRTAYFSFYPNDDDSDLEDREYFDFAPGETKRFNAYIGADISTSNEPDDTADYGISHSDIRVEFEMYSADKNELLGTTGQLKIQTESEPQNSLKQFEGKTCYEDDSFLVTSVKIDKTYYLTVKNKTDKTLRVMADKLRLFGYVLPTDIVGCDAEAVLGGSTAVFFIDSEGLPNGELSLRLIYSRQALPRNAYESSTDSFICVP